jgi:hypothetical protein
METHIATVDHTYSANDATTHSFSQLIAQDKVYAFFVLQQLVPILKVAFLCMVQVNDHYYCLS